METMKTKSFLSLGLILAALMLQALTGGAQPSTKISGGFGESLFIKSDGSLWAMGRGLGGELGDGLDADTNRPEQIVASNVVAVAAGWQYHSLFIKSDGSLWGMGDDHYGELGDGTNTANIYTVDGSAGQLVPEQIVASNVTAIACGSQFSLFLKSDGSLWGMGLNDEGQLGNGTFNSTTRPVQFVTSTVVALAAGVAPRLFNKRDSSLWVMGENESYGMLGDGTFNQYQSPRADCSQQCRGGCRRI